MHLLGFVLSHPQSSDMDTEKAEKLEDFLLQFCQPENKFNFLLHLVS